ncbi:MAG: DUF1559 domain-containing protein, partial [Thermoguttaceae bacterium]|nr:DUF1559 domain-containing protein [Thermoguttaceae bacterium]
QGIPPACHSWHRMTMWAYLYPYSEQPTLWQLLTRSDPVTLDQFFWNTSGGWGGVTLTAEEKKGFSSVPYMVCPSRRSTPASVEYQSAGNGQSSVGPCSDYCLIASTDSNSDFNGRATAQSVDNHYYVRVFSVFTENRQTYQKGFFRGAVNPTGTEGNTKSNPRDTFSRVVDGLSNQIVVGEKHIPIDGLNVCNNSPSFDNVSTFASCHDCSYLCGAEATGCGSVLRCVATYWSDDHKIPYCGVANGIDGPYDHLVANDRNGSNAAINCGLGSWHAGGCNVLKGDGSVSFMSATTPQTILGYLATVDDGNTQSN